MTREQRGDCGGEGGLETEREQLRAELAQARGRLRLLSTHTRGIIFELNAQARFVRVWASEPKLLARPEAELRGRTIVEALGVEIGARHDAAVRDALSSGVGSEYHYDLAVPEGNLRFTSTSVVVRAAPNDEPSVIVWIRDVTKESMAHVQQLQNERLTTLGTLAAGVAHEINNPLGYMLLNVRRMHQHLGKLRSAVPEQTAELEELERSLHMLSEGSHRVHKIVGELLGFSRADEAPRPIALEDTMEFAVEAAARDLEGVRLTRAYEKPPAVLANESRLVQVFVNLITNAAQAVRGQPTWTPQLDEVVLVTGTTDNGHALVEVQDRGPGIPEAVLARVFEPFFTTKERGIGLGLALCQTIITSLGGKLDVRSEEGKGTAFRVTLPPAAAPSVENPLAWS